MPKTNLSMMFDEVIAFTASRVSSLGYRRRGMALRKIQGNNMAIVEFQKSRSNSINELSFTANLAVICGDLLDEERVNLNNAKSYDAHLRVRIGEQIPPNQEIWWNILVSTDINLLSIEVSRSIIDYGIPYIEKYITNRSLEDLWSSGQSPGLTDKQRLRYLKEIRELQ